MSALDAVGTAAAIRSGEVSAREVVEDAISRLEKHNPELNVLVADRFEAALAEVDAGLPDGPLQGVPTLIKDLGMEVAGLPATRGSRLWADVIAQHDYELVRRYKAAGMVVLGMSNTPELGKNASTEPVLHGPTRNPWAPTHSPGGSSGGSAAAVAAGLVPVAHGSDGGGSIRLPSSMCGIFGLKPSRGRVTTFPDAGVLASPLGVHHMLTRSVRDSALLLDLTATPMRGSATGVPRPDGTFADAARTAPGPLRIGLMLTRADGVPLDPQVVQAARAAADTCAELGHEVVQVGPNHDPARVMKAFSTLMGISLMHAVEARLAELGRDLREDDLEPFTQVMLAHHSQSMRPTDVYTALEIVQETAWQVGRLFETCDLLLSPTLPGPVPELGVLDTTRPEVMYERGGHYSAMTSLYNLTGQPAMSVPFGHDAAGLPIGVQFVADMGREDLLLSVAGQLESAAPWTPVAPGYGC